MERGVTTVQGRPGRHRLGVTVAIFITAVSSLLASTGRADAARLASAGSTFNVTSYGAHGDGAGDNTAAFRSAIAAAQAAGSGNVVFVPAGTYTFSTTGVPASIQIDGTVPIAFEGASEDTAILMETTAGKDLLSVKCNGTVIEDLTLNTQAHNGGHGLGVGASNTTAENLQVLTGTETFGIYYPGGPHATPAKPVYSTGNAVNNVILKDNYHGDGWSFSFQSGGSISNVHHTGSRIVLYADINTTVTNYYYTPGTHGATGGFIISTPCKNLTITNFVTSGEGGQIKTAPIQARVNQNITINGEVMTGGPAFRLLIGDVQGLLIENSTLGGVIIGPKIIAQGTVTGSAHTSVIHRQRGSAVDDIVFS
jgi:Pectate lyase superfamily protein